MAHVALAVGLVTVRRDLGEEEVAADARRGREAARRLHDPAADLGDHNLAQRMQGAHVHLLLVASVKKGRERASRRVVKDQRAW